MTDNTLIDGSHTVSESGADNIRSDFDSLKRLWTLMKPLRGRLVSGLVYRFAQSFCLGLGFATAIWLVTDLLKDDFTPTTGWVVQITGLAILSLAGQILFGLLSSRLVWFSAFDTGRHLRLSMLERLRQLPLGFHLSRNRGDTVTMLTTDMQAVEGFISDGLPRVVEAIGLPIAILVFLAFQDWVVALSACVSIVIALPIYLKTSQHMAKLGIRRQDSQAATAARMIEFVQGIAVIRAFNRIPKGAEDFREALDVFRRISVQMVAQLTFPLAGFGLLLMLGVPIILFASGSRFLSGDIDAATAITTVMLTYALYGPLLSLTSVMEAIRMADASLTRMDRILMAKPLPEIESPETTNRFDVRFEGVSFGYGAEKVLQDISFSVPEKTMTAIVGPSGAGKSTVLNLLPRFWDVEGGSIQIGGVDLRNMSSETLSELTTMVFQDVYLFSGTIFENIAFGCPGATQAQVEKAAKAAQADAFIKAMPKGYQTRVGEAGASLSGGERQRISIARAILKDAPIVLLDEATAAIDPTNERALQAALAALIKDKTLIVVAHKLSTVRAADQILVLDAGKIVERGSHDDLVKENGLYQKLWQHWTETSHWRIGHKGTVDNK